MYDNAARLRNTNRNHPNRGMVVEIGSTLALMESIREKNPKLKITRGNVMGSLVAAKSTEGYFWRGIKKGATS